MDPISATLGVLSLLHSAYGTWSHVLNQDDPAHMIAKRLLVSASMYQSCLENFVKDKRQDEVKSDAKVLAFLEEDRALIEEVIAVFETVAKRNRLQNFLIPKLDTVRKCERTMYERVEFLQLLLLMGLQTANQEDTESVRAAISDVEGRLMWYRHIGSKARSATLQQLVEGIGTYMTEAFLLRRLSHIDYLLEAVCNKSEKSDTITAVELGRALRRFGPLKDFYLKSAAVVNRDGTPVHWFKKNWSRREAEMSLGRNNPQCYAVRYSSAIGHDFVLSIVDYMGKASHVLINNSYSGYSVVDETIKEPIFHASLCSCVNHCLRQPTFALTPAQRHFDSVHEQEWREEMADSMPTEEPRYPSAFGDFSSSSSSTLLSPHHYEPPPTTPPTPFSSPPYSPPQYVPQQPLPYQRQPQSQFSLLQPPQQFVQHPLQFALHPQQRQLNSNLQSSHIVPPLPPQQQQKQQQQQPIQSSHIVPPLPPQQIISSIPIMVSPLPPPPPLVPFLTITASMSDPSSPPSSPEKNDSPNFFDNKELVSPIFQRSNNDKFFSGPPPPPSPSPLLPHSQSPTPTTPNHQQYAQFQQHQGMSASAVHIQAALQALESSPDASAVVVGMLKLCLAEIGRTK